MLRQAPDNLPCFEFQGSVTGRGYGRISTPPNICIVIHVWIYKLLNPNAIFEQVDHLCHNRRCWQPSHLEGVTQEENLYRQYEKTGYGKKRPMKAKEATQSAKVTEEAVATSLS